MWWDQRHHAAQGKGYAPGAVICGECEVLFQDVENTNSPDKVLSEEVSNIIEKKSKKLILIRHAESENNVDKREAKIGLNNIKTAQGFPTFSQVCYKIYIKTICCRMNHEHTLHHDDLVTLLSVLFVLF
jgi:hypothetical protein